MNITSDCWDGRVHQDISNYASTQLWRYVRKNAKENEAEETLLNLTNISGRELHMLANIRYLLSDEVRELIWNIAPKIISRLSKASVNETITERNQVKGRINWQKTLGTRAVSGNDKSLFVYSQRSQMFDLPENRLFLHLIEQINKMAKLFADDEYLSLTWYAEAEKNGKWTNKISVIAYRTEKMLKIPVISKISSVKELNHKFTVSARRCRAKEYKRLAEIGEDYILVKQNPLDYLDRELNGNILEPLNKDTLYETAVLFKTMETASLCGWQEVKTSLIGGASNSVCIYQKNLAEMKIYMQHMPDMFKESSLYGPLMVDYGLSNKLRRPDIILEISKDEQTWFLIIEVKRSKQRAYLADGTYKLFGYLKDFEKITENACLTGFLVGWSGVNAIEYMPGNEVGLFNWTDYLNGIKTYLDNISL